VSDCKAAALILACMASFTYITGKDAGRSTWMACRLALIGAFSVLMGSFGYVGFVYLRGALTYEFWDGWSEFGSYLFAYGFAQGAFVLLKWRIE